VGPNVAISDVVIKRRSEVYVMGRQVYWIFAWSIVALLEWTSVGSADWFVSAASRNSVLRFSDNGTLLGDFVAPGAGGLTNPQGITFGPDGNLYVSSFSGTPGNNHVLQFDGETGSFLGVFASVANMVWPAEINFRGGHLYVSDFSAGTTGRVSRFDATTGAFVDHFAIAPTGRYGTRMETFTSVRSEPTPFSSSMERRVRPSVASSRPAWAVLRVRWIY
jgi:DNA-binding beta-propeller fold protein YncE